MSTGARFQRRLRLIVTEMIGIQEQKSKGVRQWQRKHNKWFVDNRNCLGPYENLCDLFKSTATTVGDDLVDSTDGLVQKLQIIRNRIPEKSEQQLLEDQLRAEQSVVDQQTNELKKLKADCRKFEKQQDELECSSARDKSKRKDPEITSEELGKKVSRLKKSIKDKESALKESQALYEEQAVEYFDQSVQNELKRLELMKTQVAKFVDLFEVDCKEFSGLFDNFDPVNELKKWKQQILNQNFEENEIHNNKRVLRQQSAKTPSSDYETAEIEKSSSYPYVKARSTGDDVFDKKKLVRQPSTKTRTPENENGDIEISKCQQAAEIRPSDNETSDNRQPKRQQSVKRQTSEAKTSVNRTLSRQESVKPGDKKKSTNQESLVFSPAENETDHDE
jgi:hypothetical protein